MVKVSQIKPQKSKRFFNIYLDGNFGFSLSAKELLKLNLKIGQELSESEINNLKKQNQQQKLYDQALRFLSFRPRSEKEVWNYLKQKIEKKNWGLSNKNLEIRERYLSENKKSIDQVIELLKKQVLIDDQAFAKWWCQQRADFRPRGQKMIMAELRQKGIPHQIIQSVITSIIDEESLARKLIYKKNQFWQRLGPEKQRQKISRYLYAYGFSWSTIKKIIDSMSQKR